MFPLPVSPRLLAVFVGFWIGMSLLWTPFLAARSVRRLAGRGPTARMPVNYTLGMGAVTLVHAAAVLAGLYALSRGGGVNLLAFFEVTAGITVGFAAVAWIVLGVGLPRSELWEPAGDGYDGRLVLAAGAVWYSLCAVFVAGLLSFVGFVLAFPG